MPRTHLRLGLSTSAAVAALVALPSVAHHVRPAAAASAPPAETVIDTTILNRYTWRNIGPARGGRSIAISGVRGRKQEGYFGATGGGLWKTTDGGANWTPVTDGQITTESVGAVAVSESNPDVVYIGTGESCIRGDIQPGDGVYKSIDAGKTWKHIGFFNSDAISKIRVDPTNADIVYVADFGKYGSPSTERGVYKSTDGGNTWRQILFHNDKTGAVDISMDPHNPKILYASLWEAYRNEYQMSSGGEGSGLYKSTDGGDNWTNITRNSGLPSGIDGKIGVAVSGADANRVYTIIENENGGLFSSDDAGATWKLVNDGRNIRQRAFYYTHVAADPKNKDLVYVMNVGTFKSTDGGKTLVNFAGGDSHDLWIDPDDPNHVEHANDSGGAISFNALTQPTWSSRAYATGEFYHVALTANSPYFACGAQQDSGTMCVASDVHIPGAGGGRGGRGGGGGGRGGRGGGAPVDQSFSPGGAEPGYIAPDPLDPDIFYAGGNNGSFLEQRNRRTNQTREVNPYPRMFSGEESSVLVERWQWTYPIVFSTVNPHVLYTGSQHLWKTTNGGQTWAKISPDLTRHDPKTMGPSGGPITRDMNGPEVYAVIFTIGPSKRTTNVIWTGSDDGLVQVTRDGGTTWTNVTSKAMPDLGRVSMIDASAFDSASAYVAIKKPLLEDFSPYIFRTHDFGKTWTKITNGIPATDYVHVVREDPYRKGLLYAGTQHGFYISYDDGDHWQSLRLNMPSVQVSDIAVSDNSIAISTHGRAFYVLDDVGPLRYYTPSMTAEPNLVVFTPPPAIRSVGGAEITYWLKHPVQSLRIDITDPKGSLVQTMASGLAGDSITAANAAAEARLGSGAVAAGRGGRGGRGGGGGGRGAGGGGGNGPALTAGFNTSTWNLRYANAVSFPGMVLWGGSTTGPAAAPGKYQVRVTADGHTQTTTLIVKRNPIFTDVTDADLQEQFDLAIAIRDKVSEANSAVIQIRSIKADVADRLAKSTDPKLKAAGDKLTAELSEVEANIYQVKNQAGQDPLNFPIKVNNRLASLLEAVTRADMKPIGNAAPIFHDLSGELKVQTDKLHQDLSTGLTTFNTAAKAAGVDPVPDYAPPTLKLTPSSRGG